MSDVTPAATAKTPLRSCGLVLSLFPGAGLLDAGFTQAGFSVVRGPDTLLGQDIHSFTLAGLSSQPGKSQFDGIIAGPPCQDFSRARRRPPSGHGLQMLEELARVITEASPAWWLVENVPGVPTLRFEGYTNQRFNMFASDFGLSHRRNRSFQFGSLTGDRLTIPRGSQSHFRKRQNKPTPLASTTGRRNFADHCEMMGLPRNFTLPGLSRCAQFRVVGNGVPLPMAAAVACAIRDRRITVNTRPCPCNCGRQLTGRQTSATVACRKRLQRERENVGPTTRIFTGRVTAPGAVTHV
jgi:DNA (cytosine-5)-methyltransferase 1